METLPNDIGALQALVRQLLAENAALKAEIAELKARLQADSHNSHQPRPPTGYENVRVAKAPRTQAGWPAGHHADPQDGSAS